MSKVYRFMRGARCNAWTARFAATSTWASFATAAVDEAASHRPSTSGQEVLVSSKELSAASVGAYYSLDRALLQEASRPYAGAFYSPREPGHERRGGCKALQEEMAATGRNAVMYRPVMHTLFSAVGANSQANTNHQRLMLTGPAGAGKSIALLSLVEWARQQGWIVMYVPSCAALVQGGYFARRGSSRRWDTLTSAQQLLKGVLDAHGAQLKQIPVLSLEVQQQPAEGQTVAQDAAEVASCNPSVSPGALTAAHQDSPGRTLHDLVAGGLVGDDNAEMAVDSVLELVRQLVAASSPNGGNKNSIPVLFALDDYNYLYGTADYGWYSPNDDPRKARRRPIHTDDLVLASGLRLLDAPHLGLTTVVAANTTALSLPAPVVPELRMPHMELVVPGFTEAETRNALAHYHATGFASCLATSRQARQLHALTQGNARELRINASTLGLQLS
ncbi:hypothetical protein VaNZ11_013727 [Volvox africanus]|uniref:Small ribosomal subunit protein mS29 n=1 Tax=Volvox africanus TaxID=51714 RepID=A0ABQ5SHM9_9CHLO|nr:hypothetical protein VaNZ11_013727 [Volvox africanus]